MPKAVFVRDAALAYVQKKTVLPHGLAETAKKLEQEVASIERYLQPIAEKANALKRLTLRETRRASKIAIHLDRQAKELSKLLSLIPHDR